MDYPNFGEPGYSELEEEERLSRMEEPEDDIWQKFLTQFPVQFIIHREMKDPRDNGLYIGTKFEDSNKIGLQCFMVARGISDLSESQIKNVREDVEQFLIHLMEKNRDEISRIAQKAIRKG